MPFKSRFYFNELKFHYEPPKEPDESSMMPNSKLFRPDDSSLTKFPTDDSSMDQTNFKENTPPHARKRTQQATPKYKFKSMNASAGVKRTVQGTPQYSLAYVETETGDMKRTAQATPQYNGPATNKGTALRTGRVPTRGRKLLERAASDPNQTKVSNFFFPKDPDDSTNSNYLPDLVVKPKTPLQMSCSSNVVSRPLAISSPKYCHCDEGNPSISPMKHTKYRIKKNVIVILDSSSDSE